MENASKALLIAAGIFLILLILSLLVVLYNDISSYYNEQHEFNVAEQAQEFNAKFENYHRNDLRGTEVLSLMNRVIDYNASQAYFEGNDYERIRVTIKLGGNNILKEFKYGSEFDDTSGNKYLLKEITNTNGTGSKWGNDKKLIEISNTSSEMISELKDMGIDNVTDTQLQQLSSNISNLIINETYEEYDSYGITNRFYRADILEDILGIEVSLDSETGETKSSSVSTIKKIKEIASQYYQYMQFKRAMFDCTKVAYDEKTDRVVEMIFELQTENVEGVEKPVFD